MSADVLHVVGADVLDVDRRRVLADGVVRVVAGRIDAVGARGDFSEVLDGEVHDATGTTLVPGLINSHAHLALDGDEVPYATKLPLLSALGEPDLFVGYAEQAERNLRAGVTTVRDLHLGPTGDPEQLRVLREAVERGVVVGSRILAALVPLVIAGGHGNHWVSRRVSGPDEAARGAREAIADGADVVKLMTAHAWGPLPDRPDSWGRYFAVEELRAAIEAAHRLGVPVAAHSHGRQAVRDVVEAGVDSVEHGSDVDARALAAMEASGTFLVPTLTSYRTLVERADELGLPPDRRAEAGWVADRQRASFQSALEAGVRIAAGNDAGFHGVAHGTTFVRELEIYREYGMDPWEVLRSATTVAAELCGVGRDLGRVEPGHLADLVSVAGDPIADTAALRDVRAVWRAGSLVGPPVQAPRARIRPARVAADESNVPFT